MTVTSNMIAPTPGQIFSGNPSGATYHADSYGGITGVVPIDVLAMLKAGCGFQTGPAKILVPASGAAYMMAFPNFGDVFYDITLSANCTLSIGPASPDSPPQIMRVLIRPNGFQATLPTSGGSLVNASGAPPTPSTSAITEYAYVSDLTTTAGGI